MSRSMLYRFDGADAEPVAHLVPGPIEGVAVHIDFLRSRPGSTLQISYRQITKKGTPSQVRSIEYSKLTRKLAEQLGLASEHIEALFPPRKPKVPK